MKSRRVQLVALVSLLVASTATGSVALAGGQSAESRNYVQVRLTGYEEDPNAVSTTGRGSLWAWVSGGEIVYRLTYVDLEGEVEQAHLHFGGRAQSGGVAVILCANGEGTAGAPECPAAPGVLSGVLTAENVLGPAGQGIAPGEFGELARAVRAGKTYVNVHTSKYPAGEIRGQLEHHR